MGIIQQKQYCDRFKLIISDLLKMISPQNSDIYHVLLERISLLLSRENLCSSLYLAKYISANLILPLYAIVEERTISQITTNQQLIIQAIQQTKLAKVVNEREVHLITYPTIRIQTNNESLLQEIQTLLNQIQKQYAFTRRIDSPNINLTLYEDDSSFLDQLMASLSQEVQYRVVSLYDDIKVGTLATKQNKHQHWKPQNKKHYSLERPPNIFIRRAIESQDEQPEKQRTKGKQSDKRRKYKQVKKQPAPLAKPLFSNQDFPLLS